MANLRLGDAAAKHWAEVLASNDRITSLDLEGNKLSTDGVRALVERLQAGCSLTELKLANQKGPPISSEVELLLANTVESTSLIKLTNNVRQRQAKDALERGLMRNQDKARQKRQQEAQADQAALARLSS